MSYQVKLNVFEGPFDLLVYLIETAEMNIYDIQIAEITDQYLSYVRQLKHTDVAAAGEFMVLAAALIEIKSKMLLPRPKKEEEKDADEDPRDELVQRLLEYKRFKGAASLLSLQEEEQSLVHTKPKEDLSVYTKEPDVYLSLDLKQFTKAFLLFLIRKKRLEDMQKTYARVKRQKMSMETRMKQICYLILSKKRMKFRQLLRGDEGLPHVVLTFASMLELAKQRAIGVDQQVNFGEISLFPGEKADSEDWERNSEDWESVGEYEG